MNVTALSAAIHERLDESPADPRYWTAAEVLAALNEAQRLFVFLTLAVERIATLAIPAATPFSSVRTLIPDFMFPLRLSLAGARLRPARLSELNALSRTWRATAGTPARYSLLGLDLMAITPQPTAGLPAGLTYAAEAAALDSGDDVPEIPGSDHESLIDYAVYALRLKEGGQGLAESLPGLDRFLKAAAARAAIVRARSRAMQYDTLPAELKLADFSRQERKPK